MFELLFRKTFGRLSERCPNCGLENRIAVKLERRLPFVKDGPLVLTCRCRRCGCNWKIRVPTGI